MNLGWARRHARDSEPMLVLLLEGKMMKRLLKTTECS